MFYLNAMCCDFDMMKSWFTTCIYVIHIYTEIRAREKKHQANDSNKVFFPISFVLIPMNRVCKLYLVFSRDDLLSVEILVFLLHFLVATLGEKKTSTTTQTHVLDACAIQFAMLCGSRS